ncbi:MAG: hypothetical protein P1U89_10920 [Verrucomicrobiales bacterium]|nr:hypothetical protein [Verrucomicrobiales bacterium]
MKFFPGLLSVVLALPFNLKAAEMNERDIPAGWDLSATLALFRNLPILDVTSLPATTGDVYLMREEAFAERDGQVFTNTYHFYRKTTDGKFLEVTVVEEHHLADVEVGETAAEVAPYHRVADLSQSAKTIDSVPSKAKVRPELSKLLSYIFEYKDTLSASQAGEMARKLNYKAEGRFRPADYKQPRVCYVPDSNDGVAKIRIYGLDTLLSQRQSVIAKSDSMDNKVMEIAVDNSGNANVSLDTLKR